MTRQKGFKFLWATNWKDKFREKPMEGKSCFSEVWWRPGVLQSTGWQSRTQPSN